MVDELSSVSFSDPRLSIADEIFLFGEVRSTAWFVRNDLLRRVRLARISSYAFTSGEVWNVECDGRTVCHGHLLAGVLHMYTF
jgi:hypothetical protein